MQHGNHKKESFKLLQLSDDSKSLSELELPQVQHQRKRKILRKTRNTSPHSARLAAVSFGQHTHAHDATTSSDGLMSTACSSNFGLWIAVIMACCWLFILSYMTAVVYSENRRLEAQLLKLSANSQTVPDELQRWHESAKWLENNQTTMQQHLSEIDQRSSALVNELHALRSEFKQKYVDSSDHEKVSRLQNNVANLGAHLKDLSIEISDLKEHNGALNTDFAKTSDTLRDLNAFVHFANSSLSVGAQLSLSNETVLWLVHNATDDTRTELHRVAIDLDNFKYAINQRATGMQEDVRNHKAHLDTLTENYANVTAHVVSIENSLREHAALLSVPVTLATFSSSSSSKTNASPLPSMNGPVIVAGDDPVFTARTPTTLDTTLMKVLSGDGVVGAGKKAVGQR